MFHRREKPRAKSANQEDITLGLGPDGLPRLVPDAATFKIQPL